MLLLMMIVIIIDWLTDCPWSVIIAVVTIMIILVSMPVLVSSLEILHLNPAADDADIWQERRKGQRPRTYVGR